MSSKNVLRASIVLHWVLLVVGLVLSFLWEQHLPGTLRTWLAEERARDVTAGEIVLLVAVIPCLLGAVVGSVGLFFLQRWAAWVYLASEAVGYMAYPFAGPTVEHAFPDTFDDVSVLLSGVVLGVAFFSGALSRGPKVANSAEGAVPPPGAPGVV